METTHLFSYVLKTDDGAAPNPFWGMCTLTICKPVIRRNARIGDWVIGTGSKNTRNFPTDKRRRDFSDHICYAMKVTDIKTLKEYDEFCTHSLKDKIPSLNGTSYNHAVGDCIYDYSMGQKPTQRQGVHKDKNMPTDLSGLNSLISNQFYYFGENPIFLPSKFHSMIKRNQGHRRITDIKLISEFENWISKFKLNELYGDPMFKLDFDYSSGQCLSNCSTVHLKHDLNNLDEEVC